MEESNRPPPGALTKYAGNRRAKPAQGAAGTGSAGAAAQQAAKVDAVSPGLDAVHAHRTQEGGVGLHLENKQVAGKNAVNVVHVKKAGPLSALQEKIGRDKCSLTHVVVGLVEEDEIGPADRVADVSAAAAKLAFNPSGHTLKFCDRASNTTFAVRVPAESQTASSN